jgi:NADH-quinone oxidoreductase subunit G
MPKITIDNTAYEVPDGKTVLQVCLENDINVPYFCYHPKLSIAGNCRMCLVEVEGMNKPAISCNTFVREGMSVRTNSPEILDDRKSILEFILINHPLDCPICDQAGECDLQDQYFDHSAVPYRFREEKVKKPKAVELGDLVTLDDERCIVCTRCVRFCDEVAGVSELAVAERGDRATITTFNGQGMNNAYSLNTVDICPVGALTNRDFRFNKRAWYLENTKSICTGCATGCNIWLDHASDVVYRYRPRDNEAVNACWMCDEGRLSYKYINAADRIDAPYRRSGDGWEKLSLGTCKSVLQEMFTAVVPEKRGVVLSAQCSNEENFAWWWLASQRWAGAQIGSTARTYDNASHDEQLRHIDKNPNQKFLELLQVSEGIPEGVDLLFVLDTLTVAQIAALKASKPTYVVLLATNWGATPWSAHRWQPLAESGPVVAKGGGAETLEAIHAHQAPQGLDWVDLVLPLASFAEQRGTFTNAQGRVQRFVEAVHPKGEAASGWQLAKRVAAVEEIIWPWQDVMDLSAAIGPHVPACASVSIETVGDEGRVAS